VGWFYLLPFKVRQESNGTVGARLTVSSLESFFAFAQASTLSAFPSFLNA
jgi:hypothetical protein